MKICNKCKQEKEDREFYRAGSTLKGTCKQCMKQIRENKKKDYIPRQKIIDLIKQLEEIQEEEPDAYLAILYLKQLLEGDKR